MINFKIGLTIYLNFAYVKQINLREYGEIHIYQANKIELMRHLTAQFSSIFFKVPEAFLKSKPHKAIQAKPKRHLFFMLKVQYAALLCITQTFRLLRYYNVLENYSNFQKFNFLNVFFKTLSYFNVYKTQHNHIFISPQPL